MKECVVDGALMRLTDAASARVGGAGATGRMRHERDRDGLARSVQGHNRRGGRGNTVSQNYDRGATRRPGQRQAE
jgi:hypothetical protein